MMPTWMISAGDEEIDHTARDQEHRENYKEHDVDHKNGVHFPNVSIPPKDWDPIRRGMVKRIKSGRTVEVYGIFPPFAACGWRVKHL